MIVVDIIKIVCVVALCFYASISDIKSGIIKNKYLLIASSVGLVLDVISWCTFDKDNFIVHSVNILIVWAISFLMYVFHIWAGGDCKFAAAISLLIPFSLYPLFFGKWFALAFFMAISFILSYFYLIADSIVHAIKKKRVVNGKKLVKGLLNFVIKCVVNLSYIILLDSILLLAFPKVLSDFSYFMILFNICLIFIISGVKFLANKYLVAAIILADIVISVAFNLQIVNKYMLVNYFVACLTLIFRLFIDEYNYDVIKTEDVKKGMVLSMPTVLSFANSHVKGLPTSTTEDLRSRLTQEEAQSVRRWEKSKYGSDTVQIVRKIPFAIFISLGAIVFLILGGLFQ